MKAFCPHHVRWFRWCAACAEPDDFVSVEELVDTIWTAEIRAGRPIIGINLVPAPPSDQPRHGLW